jgi:hypothetical protein
MSNEILYEFLDSALLEDKITLETYEKLYKKIDDEEYNKFISEQAVKQVAKRLASLSPEKKMKLLKRTLSYNRKVMQKYAPAIKSHIKGVKNPNMNHIEDFIKKNKVPSHHANHLRIRAGMEL